MNKKIILSFLVLSAATAAGTAQAVTASTTFPVTALVLTSCAVSATPLAFASYDPAASSTIDAANSLLVTCTTGVAYTVGLSVGVGTGATVATRKMTNVASAGNLLTYSLYSDAGRSSLWGNTVGTDTLAATATATPNTIAVYGRVFAGQNVPAGAYSDTVTVTVNY